jgi:hypothetical protein
MNKFSDATQNLLRYYPINSNIDIKNVSERVVLFTCKL